MMPWLNNFTAVDSRGWFVWMRECWNPDTPDNQVYYSVLDTTQALAVANSIPHDVTHVMLGHEQSPQQGRAAWNIANSPDTALQLFIETVNIFRAVRPDILFTFYNLLNADELEGFADYKALDELVEHLDFFAPDAYARELRPASADARYIRLVEWLQENWPVNSKLGKPVYLCASPYLYAGQNSNRVQTSWEMSRYLIALEAARSDGIIWWARKDDGIRSFDGEGLVNAALKTKYWNSQRYNHPLADWAEELRRHVWLPA